MSIRSLLLAPLAAFILAEPVLAAPAPATHAGFMVVQVPDPQGPPVTVGIWYPTDAPAAPMTLGLGSQTVAKGAPLAGDHLPLVVMSHGNGGVFSGHADTAQALAEAGFVVAALTHTGDNYRDQSRATDAANRPRQLSLLIDYMLTAAPMKAAIDPDRVGAFGFSAGGFTVLVAAGATPDLKTVGPHCQAHPDYFDCKLMKDHPPPADALRAAWVHDARIKAVVAAAPALGYALDVSHLTAPLQLWRAENDQILPDPDYATAVRARLPKAPDYHLAAGAGHFDFLAPCNAENQASAAFICSSTPGFDRAAFHRDFDRAVVGFFEAQLPPRR